MSDITTRERFIGVIARNLQAGARRARTLGLSASKVILRVLGRIIVPTRNRWAARLDDHAFTHHPALHAVSNVAILLALVTVPAVDVALKAAFTAVLPALVTAAGTSTAAALALFACTMLVLTWAVFAAALVATWLTVAAAKVLRFAAAAASNGVSLLVAGLTGAITLVALGISLVLTAVGTVLNYGITLLHKIVWGLTLVLQTPGLALAGGDALTTDWSAYLSSWTPKRFHCNTLSDVVMQETREANALVLNFPVDGKGRPTPKQTKRVKTLGPVNAMGAF